MKINLKKEFFKETEYELISYGEFSVKAFKYSTGVEALKVENSEGYYIILPYQGQQIWKLHFNNEDLSMITTVKEPVPTLEYLKTYGGFLYHCGVSAFGVPQAGDKHPQHGETPNIPYDNAYIICDEDENGKFVSVGGVLNYDIAFVRKYQFVPECKLYEKATTLKINISITNQRHTPMEYMYLCHINFKPINGSRLVYNVPRDKEHVKVFKVVPDSLPKEHAEKLASYMDALQENPALMDTVGADGQIYDPEICFALTYKGDENNRAYTMQYKDGEGACYVDHPADVLPVSIRWISRTADEDSMGMVLPATAEHLGYTHAKNLGQIKVLGGMETLSFTIETGYISDEKAKQVEAKVNSILK